MTIKLYKTVSAIVFILCVMAGSARQCHAYNSISTLNIKGMAFRQFASLVSQATSQNIIVSKAAGSIPVHLFLENVDAEQALEAACRAYQCWYRKDSRTGIICVVTLEEYRQGMAVNDEELVKVVKLNHTGARMVGESIKRLFRDRVIWETMDYEQGDSDMQDLESALERMDMLAERTQFTLDGSEDAGSVTTSGSSRRSRSGTKASNTDEIGEKVEVDVDSETLLTQLVERQEGGGGKHARRPGVVYVTILKDTNSILLRSTDTAILSKIEKLISDIDQPKPQVLIEVKLLEIEIDNENSYGVDWLFQSENENVSGGRSTGLVGSDTFGDSFSSILSPGTGLVPQTSTGVDARSTVLQVVSNNVLARLQLLEENGAVKSLATPNLCVADGEASRVFVGKATTILESIEITKDYDSDGNLQSTEIDPETERLNVGMSLLITPEINTDESVTIRIVQEDSELGSISTINYGDSTTGGSTSFESQEVETRTVTTTIIAMNGQISAVGGLIKEEETLNESGIPGAKDLPVVGSLFKTETKVKSRTELLVLLRPYILRAPSETEEVTLKFLDDLSNHPDAQSDFPAFGNYSGNLRHNRTAPHTVPDWLKKRSWAWMTK